MSETEEFVVDVVFRVEAEDHDAAEEAVRALISEKADYSIDWVESANPDGDIDGDYEPFEDD